jgi:ectoine hydroxylase-related dioxygenase (phytanoyl-CoA dioxygenase family)
MTFATHGYTVRQLFAPGLIAVLHTDILAHMDRVAHALHLPFENSEPDAPLAERLDRIAARDPSLASLLRIAACTDAHRAPALRALSEDAVLSRCIRELLERPPEELIMRLRANVPALPAERQPWHSDVALADGSSCSRVRLTCWIPLMDAGPGSGGLELVTGRRSSPFTHRQKEGRFEIPEGDLAGLPRLQPDCPAGSVLFMDSYTPHRALPNHSGRARWSLVIWVKVTEAPPAALS